MATKAGAKGSKLREYHRKRHFDVTAEPEGVVEERRGALRFFVQKHRASHLHFDFRLELDGVLKSWAVPKGPSLDPSVKRLAMEVEDHPLAYGDFEGTIPEGEYGGGTVMLWDRGTYGPEEPPSGREAEESELRHAYARGDLKIELHGERLRGGFVLVRMKRPGKPQWLLIKHRDEHAEPGSDVVAETETSVKTGRTMDEIAAGKGGRRTWSSNRRAARGRKPARPDRPGTRAAASKSGDVAPAETPARIDRRAFTPMLAESASVLPEGSAWTFEPKYDGIRVLAFVAGGAAALVTRNGRNKAAQFPDVVDALKRLGERAGRPVVLDGEVVAVSDGELGRFEALQGRMHLEDRAEVRRQAAESPAAFVAFDILVDGDDVLTDEPWTERRRRLERLLKGEPAGGVRLSESRPDGEELMAWARREGWEGVVAKRKDSPYRMGVRSGDWRKVKAEGRQEFVIGGYTEPRRTREHFGAILLGYYDDDGRFRYAGHPGTGFTREQLASLYRAMRRIERRTSPFLEAPRTNEPAHWVTPKIVVEIKFNEWTTAGKLRQPVFLGVRDDKDAREVVREMPAGARTANGDEGGRRGGTANGATESRGRSAGGRRASRRSRAAGAGATPRPAENAIEARLGRIRERGGAGMLELGHGARVEVSSLDKVFFPRIEATKGDLIAYYARMAPVILPAMKDRPLVLKRFPNGVEGKAFYQQSAPDDAPAGVRVETVVSEDGEEQRRFVGGSLTTLLYTIQLGAISYDPWHSRVGRLDYADYTILDLDPGPKAKFGRVVEVALHVREELDRLGLHAAVKTSGASGIHIFLPLPARTPLDAATLLAQLVATRVASRHPKIATIERMTRKRPPGAVYVDYLQNIRGKTVAGVYAVRATERATVSTPLAWEELTPELDPRAFTMATVPERVERVGDLWGPAMKQRNSLGGLRARAGAGAGDELRAGAWTAGLGGGRTTGWGLNSGLGRGLRHRAGAGALRGKGGPGKGVGGGM